MCTHALIGFGTYNAFGMKQDTTLSCNVTLQGFSYIDDLKLHDPANSYPYATFEPDFWLLDGSYKIKPVSNTGLHTGLMTLAQSGADGVFATAPVLTVTFGTAYNTDGLTLYFDEATGDYCNSVTVAYYNASNALIRSDTYTPTGTTFNTEQSVTGFKKIIITFTSTHRAYRYLRLHDIDYAAVTYFSGKEIKAATLVEQICPTSTELPINTLDFQLYSNNPAFSIFNPTGQYALLKNKQPLYCYEYVDGVYYLMGKFFLDTWENLTEKVIAMHATDIIGVLDSLTYDGDVWGSDWQPSDTVQSVCNFLFTYRLNLAYGFTVLYDFDGDYVRDHVVKGDFPPESYRNAIKRMAFSALGYVSTARSEIVHIKNAVRYAGELGVFDYTFTPQDVSIKSISLKPLITDVTTRTIKYSFSSGLGTTKTLYKNSSLAAGTYKILFDTPSYPTSQSASGATITDAQWHTCTFVVASPGAVEITGLVFPESAESITASYIPYAGVPRNSIVINDIRTYCIAGTLKKAGVLIDYYSERFLVKLKTFASLITVGNSVLVDTYEKQIAGYVERVETNLTGGFISTVDVVGIVYTG